MARSGRALPERGVSESTRFYHEPHELEDAAEAHKHEESHHSFENLKHEIESLGKEVESLF